MPRKSLRDPKLSEVSLRLSNTRAAQVSFVLEPWGDVIDFAPGDEIIVTFQGPESNVELPEVEFSEESVTVYGWTGSYASVLKNGKMIIDGAA